MIVIIVEVGKNQKKTEKTKFVAYYKDNENENRILNKSLTLKSQNNLGHFSRIIYTEDGKYVIKFGNFKKPLSLIEDLKNEFRGLLFNIFLNKLSTILFAKIKEAGMFFDSNNKLITYSLYERYDYDLYTLLYTIKINLIIDKNLKKIEFINNLIQQIMTAIKEMNKNNLVHGDIKPENILIREIKHNEIIVDYQYSLCDFGTTSSNGRISYNLNGSAEYMSAIKFQEYFSCMNNKREIQIISRYTDDYFSLGYMFYKIINLFFISTISLNIKSLFEISNFPGSNVNKKIYFWITNYTSTIKKISEHLDKITTLISITNSNKETFIWKKFEKGLELIKYLFASNNPSYLENIEIAAREKILLQQKINEYLAFTNI